MKSGLATMSSVGVISAVLCLSTVEAPAMPMSGVSPSATAAEGMVFAERVNCHCVVRRHRSRRVFVEPAEPYLFPAPPVGITLRKIFGLGYL